MSKRKFPIIASYTVCLAFVFYFAATTVSAQSNRELAERIQKIVSRPEFVHSNFGVAFYSLDSNKPIFLLNAEKLFVPASTTKLLTEGTALEFLGSEHRFRTRVYRTGLIKKNGVLDGDLILVAGGDPNLSNRVQPDGTLSFENEDHSYGGPDSKGLPGDPLLVLRELAEQIANSGVKRVTGRLLVDVTLFPEGDRESGTGVVISPMVVNDNLIDVIATPGLTEGAPIQLRSWPQTAYIRFINQATTSKVGSSSDLKYTDEKLGPDGTRNVNLTGTLSLGSRPQMNAYPVPEPSRYAAMLLVEALRDKGIAVQLPKVEEKPDFKFLRANYTPENLVAEHLSPPLKEEVRVTLKVSQNLHASMTPFILGALVAHKDKEIDQAGFNLENDFLKKAGLDLSGASQSDGWGGNAFFTPDFMVHYLIFMSKHRDFAHFYNGLPVLGRDGTLAQIQVNSPAAGHVRAKTGTYTVYDALNKDVMVTGKGLAGYMKTASGERLALSVYANMVAVPMADPEAAQKIVGEALGEIAAAAYDSPLLSALSATSNQYDVVIKNGKIVDGSGNPWVSGDLGIRRGRIASIGRLDGATAKRVIDATGLIVSPGFIDMLGQSDTALLIDNRSLSKLSQGITTEITGEGQSIAPQDALTLKTLEPEVDHYHLNVDWTDLNGYFERLEKTGTPLNIGTYVGAAQVREAVLGDVDRAPTPEELERMKDLVAHAMQQGAFGISTALIFQPGSYATTHELIELATVAGQYGGIYGTHMRSEGQTEVRALEEALRIGAEAHIPVEIFHLKVSGKGRWGSMPKIVSTIQAARDSGQDISADMYPYIAGGTALISSLPPWVAEGGLDKLLGRIKDPSIREKITFEMASDHPDWENLYFDSGGAAGVMVSGAMNPELKKYDGKTIAQIATEQKKRPLDALFDFILADEGRSGALYFNASESDLQYGLRQAWTSICLDSGERSLDGPLFRAHGHPRAFGAMPRLLGRYVRDLHLLTLEQAIRKITSLPAQRERLRDRGLLKEGYFADITIFDPATVRDTATYANPAQISEGVKYVFVNGELEFENGGLTGVTAGKPLRGPGFQQTEEQ